MKSNYQTPRHYIGMTRQEIETCCIEAAISKGLKIPKLNIPEYSFEQYPMIDGLRRLIIDELRDKDGISYPKEEINISNVILFAECGLKVLSKVNIDVVISNAKIYFSARLNELKPKPSDFLMELYEIALDHAKDDYNNCESYIKDFCSKSMDFFETVKEIWEVI